MSFSCFSSVCKRYRPLMFSSKLSCSILNRFNIFFALIKHAGKLYIKRTTVKLVVPYCVIAYTANELPVRIQYKCLVPIYVFLEMKLLFPKQNYNVCLPVPTLIYLWEIYICLGLVLQEICGPFLEIYKSLTSTWMWKLGLRPHNSQKRNT
jgi:hypothetical protein